MYFFSCVEIKTIIIIIIIIIIILLLLFVGKKWHLFLPMSVRLPMGFESTVLLIPN